MNSSHLPVKRSMLAMSRVARLSSLDFTSRAELTIFNAESKPKPALISFDSNPALVGCRIDGKEIHSLDKLGDYCRENGVEIGVITTPAAYAQEVSDLLVSAGIKAIWNFAPAHIYVPDGVLVQNENMACSLALLSKHLNEMLGE